MPSVVTQNTAIPSVIILNVIMTSVFLVADVYADIQFAKPHNGKCCGANFASGMSVWHYVTVIMQSLVMPIVIVLHVTIKSVIMLSVMILYVIMTSSF